MSLIDYGVCVAISPSGVRPVHSDTCTVQRPEQGSANPAAGRFPRPEQPIPAERTSASQLAEENFREPDELPSIVSRQRTAKALRDLLTTHRLTVTKFAAMHDVNEKQAAKWLDGRANYPAWGFDVLTDEMSDALYAAVRGGKQSGPNALRSRVNRLDHAGLVELLGLVGAAMGKK